MRQSDQELLDDVARIEGKAVRSSREGDYVDACRAELRRRGLSHACDAPRLVEEA